MNLDIPEYDSIDEDTYSENDMELDFEEIDGQSVNETETDLDECFEPDSEDLGMQEDIDLPYLN